VSRYQKGRTNLDFTEARDSEWQWRQLGHMQVCTSLQTDNHASTPPLCLLQAGCPSCRPTHSVKALKAANSICECNSGYRPHGHDEDERDGAEVNRSTAAAALQMLTSTASTATAAAAAGLQG